jgi:2-amino-4-hydroxy-6-hydroxymethyldihydropteridine diphosphokinase
MSQPADGVWRPAYVAIGSNLNSPAERVREAFTRFGELKDTRLISRSALYASRPLGPQTQPDFVNAAVGLLTRLAPPELLESLLAIERAMGRERHEKWGPRLIDLDLLWMPGASIANETLTLPHPGVSSRNFVLYPLAEIAPMLVIPGLGSVAALKQGIGADGLKLMEQ